MNTNDILTFSGSKTKAQIVEMAKYHRDMDLLIQGEYGKYCEIGQNNKGCSVGCMFPNKHSDGYSIAGVCPQLLYLVDKYFEKQDKQDAIDFHVWFWENLPEGIDSFELFSQFMGKMLIDPNCGAFGKSEKSDKHLLDVSKLYLDNCKDSSKYAYADAAYAAAYADAAYAAAYAAAAARKSAFQSQIALFKEVIIGFQKTNFLNK